MNKKGDLTFTELIGFILGGIIIFVLIFFVMGISDIIKNNPEQAAFDNFDALVNTINDVVSAEPGKSLTSFQDRKIEIVPAQKNAVQAVIPFYLQDGFTVVGFDKDTINWLSCPGLNKHTADIPKECISKPCICLGKQSPGILGNYQSCKSLKNVNQLRTINQGRKTLFNLGGDRETGGSDLVLFSSCALYSGSFNVRDVKILRMPSSVQGKYDVLIDVLPK